MFFRRVFLNSFASTQKEAHTEHTVQARGYWREKEITGTSSSNGFFFYFMIFIPLWFELQNVWFLFEQKKHKVYPCCRKTGRQICCDAVVRRHGSHLLLDNDGVSQMEHERCVFVYVSVGKEDLMSLLWAIIATLLSNNKQRRFTAP